MFARWIYITSCKEKTVRHYIYICIAPIIVMLLQFTKESLTGTLQPSSASCASAQVAFWQVDKRRPPFIHSSERAAAQLIPGQQISGLQRRLFCATSFVPFCCAAHSELEREREKGSERWQPGRKEKAALILKSLRHTNKRKEKVVDRIIN